MRRAIIVPDPAHVTTSTKLKNLMPTITSRILVFQRRNEDYPELLRQKTDGWVRANGCVVI